MERCLNSAQPELMCNGICYLKKQVSKTVEEDGGSQENKSNISKTGLDYFVLDGKHINYLLRIYEMPTTIDYYKDLFSQIHLNYIFHPPIFKS